MAESDQKPYQNDFTADVGANGGQMYMQQQDDGMGGGNGNIQAGDHRNSADICRDFMKNICNRGSRCKYYHPPDAPAAQNKEDFKFCIDYQNRGCQRDNCRYVHAHREDADHYKSSGEITHNLARAIAAVTNKDNVNGIPFCKEFQMGKCSRGQNRCRYWHINPHEERERRTSERGGGGQWHGERDTYGTGRGGSRDRSDAYRSAPADAWGYQRGGPTFDFQTPYDEAYGVRKRPRYDEDTGVAGGAADFEIAELRRKNAELMQRNDELERELKRTRERYEDLYTLTVRQQQNQQVAPPIASFAPAASVLTPVLTVAAAAPQAVAAPIPQQPTVMSVQAPPQMAPNVTPNAAAGLVSLAQQVAASIGATPQMHQSMAAMSGPSDVAVHWSTMRH